MEKYKPAGKLGRREITRLIQDILQHIADNRDSIQVLLSENGDIGFQKRILSKALEWIQGWGIFNNEAPDAKVIEYYSIFCVGGVLAFIQQWLKTGMDTPIPDMANMLVKLMAGVL
jgi:hypothetical protein